MGLLDAISPTPRNRILGLLADATHGVNDFASKPFGYDNPPARMLMGLLGVPSIATTLDRLSYGEPLTNIGKANVPLLKPETADAAMAAAAALPAVSRGALKASDAAVRAITKNPQATATRVVDYAAQMRPAQIFAGVNAKTADTVALAKAEEMTSAGVDPRKVWSETGWFKGADGKWRFEIDDSKAMFNPSGVGASKKENDILVGAPGVNFGPAIGLLEHPILENSYGKGLVQNSFVGNKNTMFGDGVQGAYDSAAGSITINAPAKAADARSTMLHELQHAVQQREGFANGGSADSMSKLLSERDATKDRFNRALEQFVSASDPIAKSNAQQEMTFYGTRLAKYPKASSPAEAYTMLAGEAEARAVQKRMNLTPEQRRALFPFDSYDVPIDQLIIR